MSDTKDLDDQERRIAEGIAACLKELMRPEWIPVSERLPEIGAWCWVYTGSGPFPAIYDARSTNGWTNGDTWEDFDHAVTHWMKLPEPPEVK
jgi:hypothetical protein